MPYKNNEDGIKGTLWLNEREIEITIPKIRPPRRPVIFGLWAYYCGYTSKDEVAAQVSIDGGPWKTTYATWPSEPGQHVATYKYTPLGGTEQILTVPFVTEDVIARQEAGGVYGIDCFFPCQQIEEPSAPIIRIPEGYDPDITPGAIALPYACTCCGYRFLTTEERDTHQLACPICPYACTCCEARFPTITERDTHQAICPTCVQLPSPPPPTPPTQRVAIVPIISSIPTPSTVPTTVPTLRRVAVQLPTWVVPAVVLAIGGVVLYFISKKK